MSIATQSKAIHCNGTDPADDYRRFVASKTQLDQMDGFTPIELPSCMKPFQRHATEWAIRKGRSAMFQACGLGKTLQELVYADNVVRHTNKPFILLTPLAVAQQTVREGHKFGIDCYHSRDGKFPNGARIIVTNYERLHYFDQSEFGGGCCDESGCIKDFKAQRTGEITEFFRLMPYRLLGTAYPAPNDYDELGTSAECLGEMGYQDMITKFFTKQTAKDYLGWGRTKYRLKGHADGAFWRWVCSWARAARKPSDLGSDFDDAPYILPPLDTHEHLVVSRTKRPGFLLDLPAITLPEQKEERRRTIQERCEKAAELVNGTGKPAVVWCHLNPEGDLCEKLIPDAVQVSGSDSDEVKEERLVAFQEGKVRVLVTKPVIAAWGLNWQHCSHQTFFPDHSYERYAQAIARSRRFGNPNRVRIDMVVTEGEQGVMDNLHRKADANDAMFDQLVSLMHESLEIRRSNPFTRTAEVPPWLS